MTWTRCEREGNDGVLAGLEELAAAGVAVPSVLAIQDLRGLSREGRVPPFRELARRWGWGEKRARLLLSNEARWVDPQGGVEGHKQGTNRAQTGHKQGTNDEPVEPIVETTGHKQGTSRAQAGHKQGYARVPYSDQTGQDKTQHPDSEPVSDPTSNRLFRESTNESELQPAKKPAAKKPKPASNPWTDAWASAWKACSGGNAYPWAGSYHRCSALSKALPNASLDGVEERMVRAIKGGTVTFERWAVREKEEVLRRQVGGGQRESVGDLVNLFDPTPPTVEQKRPYTIQPSQDTSEARVEPIAPGPVTQRAFTLTDEERQELRRKMEADRRESLILRPAPPGSPGPRKFMTGEK